MEPLSFTPSELARAQETIRALLSPLDHDTLDDWKREVTRTFRRLMGADISAFMLPNIGADPLLAEGVTEVTSEDYLAAAGRAYADYDLAARFAHLRVCTHAELLGERRTDYNRTAYVQDFLRRMQCFDGVSIAGSPQRTASLSEMPLLHLHTSDPRKRYESTDAALMRLVQPAFEAGIEIVRRAQARREELLRTLDALSEGLLLIDAGTGRVLHANRALTRLGADDPTWANVEAAMARLGHDFVDGRLYAARPERDVRTGTASYRLRVALLGEELMGRAPAVLVSAERLSAQLPSPEDLCARFGLTPRQAEVALLLAEGLPDRAVAERLSISPHTARNHAKHVLAKLEVDARAQVRPRLERR